MSQKEELYALQPIDNWRTQTCESCRYQMDGECRRNPPFMHIVGSNQLLTEYPRVILNKGFAAACATHQKIVYERVPSDSGDVVVQMPPHPPGCRCPVCSEPN